MAVRQNLLARHPGLKIEGDNFPATPLRRLISALVFYIKMPLILILVTGTKFFEVSGIAVPEWYAGAQENKLMTIVGLFFIGNMVETSMLSSGAFEITVNGEPVWSKMETGYLPSLEHLVSLVEDKLGGRSAEFTPDLETLSSGDF